MFHVVQYSTQYVYVYNWSFKQITNINMITTLEWTEVTAIGQMATFESRDVGCCCC